MQNKLFIISSFLLIALSSISQTLYNSPYSRYGIGIINSKANTFQLGQGGVSYTTNRFNQVNISNPASYPSIRKHSPIFDMAINGDYSDIKSSTSNQLYRNGSIANFTLGLPIGKRSGLAFNYQPFANMGYNIVDSLTNANDEKYANNYIGQGGLNKLTGGFGRLLFQSDSANIKISAGINASYVYGSYFHFRQSDFESGSSSNSLLVNDSTSVKDVIIESGLLGEYKVNKDVNLTFGLNYTFGKKLSAKNEFLAYTYSGNTAAVLDTMSYLPSTSGKISLPSSIGFALEMNYKHKLGVGIQYTISNWSDYKNDFGSQNNVTFQNTNELNAGLWYKPSGAKGNSKGGALKNATFKTGFRNQTLPIVINGTSINEMAVSLGMHLPLVNSGSFSSVNFGTEFGKRGSIVNGLVEEQFIKLRLGLSITPSINDRWFVKRKYD